MKDLDDLTSRIADLERQVRWLRRAVGGLAGLITLLAAAIIPHFLSAVATLVSAALVSLLVILPVAGFIACLYLLVRVAHGAWQVPRIRKNKAG